MFITEKQKDDELAELVAAGAQLWLPDPENTPQMQAYLSVADDIGFGGAAGGGKTDLMIGKALNQHSDSMIMRRVGTELDPVITRVLDLWGSREGFAGGHPAMLKYKRQFGAAAPNGERTIEFCAVPNLGDERKFQGHPNDLKGYDEATNFLVKQVRFLQTWLRNTRVPDQYRQQLFTFNPPQDAEGRWVIEYWAPWLDRQYKNPAAHGELRYFITVGEGDRQRDIEVPNVPHVIIDGQPVRDFDRSLVADARMIIQPRSRTFIGSKVTDNKYQDAGYIANLQSLPEPLRSQMLNGDFYAGMNDSEWQVIPSAWIRAAMDRWQPRDRIPPMDSMGVDVARGGADNSIIARRHDNWYNTPIKYAGKDTPNGHSLMARVVEHLRDSAPVHIDVVGVGGSPYDFLKLANFHVIGVNGGATEGLEGFRSQGGLKFANWKSYLWWMMREDLDPANNRGIALPPDKDLERDLAAPLWKHQSGRIRVESREDIIKRIGRSPDWGSAYVMARMQTIKIEQLRVGPTAQIGHDPYAILSPDPAPSQGYDPYA